MMYIKKRTASRVTITRKKGSEILKSHQGINPKWQMGLTILCCIIGMLHCNTYTMYKMRKKHIYQARMA